MIAVSSAHSCRSSTASSNNSILFIDRAVTDYKSLKANVLPEIEVVALDCEGDGILQISQVLAARQGISSIHVVSHGSPGGIQLGNAWLSIETLERYAWDLQAWAESLTTDAELLIYGCEVAAGERGQLFIAQLCKLTGIKIAASATKTGSTALGGNWELEVRTNRIRSPLAFQVEAMETYQGILN